ncbi:hypothetical protein COX58_02145 [archaeon CG_4_10_14_0_2_um_filter_Archaea_38_6]|nr:MAG: hypothetical protein COX58_02145 [archaeon CG_4_10_14_0_2_um_filter_Archaea_38_6]
MKIKIPRKLELKFNLEKAKNVFSFIGFVLFSALTLSGIVYGIQYARYEIYIKDKEEQCQTFTQYLNDEVLSYTTANVTDCNCHYANTDVGKNIVSNCLCSCKLYDENGTIIDEYWNPLFSTI